MKKKHDINIVCVEFLPLHHTKSDRSWAEQVICLLKIQRHIHKHSPLYWQCSTEDVIYIFVEFVCLLLYKTCSLLTSSCLSAEFTVCTGDETDAGVQERRREKTRTSTVDYNTYNPSDRVPVDRNLFRSLSLSLFLFCFCFYFVFTSLRTVSHTHHSTSAAAAAASVAVCLCCCYCWVCLLNKRISNTLIVYITWLVRTKQHLVYSLNRSAG